MSLIFRRYRNLREEDQTEEVLRELDNLKSNSQEIMLFVSVLGKMILASNRMLIDRVEDKSDREIMKILVDYQDRDGIATLKEQELKNLSVM